MVALEADARRAPCLGWIDSVGLTAFDPRAENARRSVHLERRRVVIRRRVEGITMTIGVPATAYRGVVLSVEARSDEAVFRLTLTHRDPDLSIPLYEAGHDGDVVAEWKAWAAFFALPKFCQVKPGELQGDVGQLGALWLGRVRPKRRRGATMTKRRPRFGQRRRVDQPSAAPVRYAGEAEIIAPD